MNEALTIFVALYLAVAAKLTYEATRLFYYVLVKFSAGRHSELTLLIASALVGVPACLILALPWPFLVLSGKLSLKSLIFSTATDKQMDSALRQFNSKEQ